MSQYRTYKIGDCLPLSLKALKPNMQRDELLHQKFNRLTIVRFLGSDILGRTFCECMCKCGKSISANLGHLKSGNTKSCGCQKSDAVISRNILNAHPHRRTRIFRIWKRMHQRCYIINCDDYNDYGAKGVIVCSEWHEYYNFYNWATSHGYSDDLSIDRIEVTGIYEPSNCRWATPIEQARNKRNNHFIFFRGHNKTLSEWCQIFKIESSKVRYRLSKNWPLEKAFIN